MKKKIEDQRESIKSYITSGAPEDYARYREAVGRIVSCDVALRDLEDIEQKYLEE